MNTLEFGKVLVLMVSLLLTAIVIDDIIDNIILYSKMDNPDYMIQRATGKTQIFPVGLCIFAIIFWTGFYVLNLL
jgi:hypothetical protein